MSGQAEIPGARPVATLVRAACARPSCGHERTSHRDASGACVACEAEAIARGRRAGDGLGCRQYHPAHVVIESPAAPGGVVYRRCRFCEWIDAGVPHRLLRVERRALEVVARL